VLAYRPDWNRQTTIQPWVGKLASARESIKDRGGALTRSSSLQRPSGRTTDAGEIDDTTARHECRGQRRPRVSMIREMNNRCHNPWTIKSATRKLPHGPYLGKRSIILEEEKRGTQAWVLLLRE